MTQVDLSEEVFLAKVEEEHPLAKCSEQARLVSDIQTTLADSDDKLQTFVNWLKEHKEEINFNEPRIKGALQTLYRESGILEKLQQYGESIKQELRQADLAKMSGIETFLSYLGACVPKRTKITELRRDVVLPEGVIRDCLDLLSDIGISMVDEVDPSILDILKQIDELDKDEEKITRSLGRVSQLLDESTSVSDATVVVADTVVVSPQQPTSTMVDHSSSVVEHSATMVESPSTMVDMRDRQPRGNGNLDAAMAAIQRQNEEEERAGLGTEDIPHAGDIADTIHRGDQVDEEEKSVSPRRG
jgi:prefoldin subunit 5